MSQIVNLTLEELALFWLELQMVLSEMLKHNVQAMQSALPLSLKRQLHHPIRLSSKSCSVDLGSSASTFGMWLGITQPKQHVLTLKEP